MRKQFLRGMVFLAVSAWTAYGAATLHIGFGAGTLCATGCGGHPNTTNSSPGGGTNGPGYILSTQFDIFQNSGGSSSTAQAPVLLIFGVAGYQDPLTDPGRFSQSTITGVTTYNPYNPANLGNAVSHPSSSWTYGTSAFTLRNPGGGYQGYFTGGDLYGFLNVGAGVTNSQSFTNWNLGIANYSPAAPAPTGYEIYVYALNVPLGPKGLIDISVATDPVTGLSVIPSKTYVLAYGLDIKGNPLSVPMTEGALQTPEPTSVLLMSSVAGTLVWMIWRRRRTNSIAS